jgi:hypothetical protein
MNDIRIVVSAHLLLHEFGMQQENMAYKFAKARALARDETPTVVTVEDAEIAIQQSDYRALLAKYMHHIGIEEGCCYTGASLTRSTNFSEEEKNLLRIIEGQSRDSK